MNNEIELLRSVIGKDICQYLDDPNVHEIYINENGYLWIVDGKRGKFCRKDICLNREKVETIIRAVAGAAHQVITPELPALGCEINELKCRVQAQVPPIVSSPTIFLRKKASTIFPIGFYIKTGFLTQEMADYLKKAIKERKNILVVGATGTGKTTFLNTLIQLVVEVTPNDRILILEDVPELQCKAEDFTKLQTYVDKDSKNNITMQMLLYYAMRLSPKRIILGEVRDLAAYTLLKAWNTGHPGGLCTTHANSAIEGLTRLEVLIKEDLSAQGDMRALIGQAVNVIVDIYREDFINAPSKRYIRNIIEVDGFDSKENKYKFKTIYQNKEKNHEVFNEGEKIY
ncbi:ATPase, T2SS/T4P/T4SS family [Dialister micraerophilus]|uniref:ATPase, T2SS/T4P/T4SS family n=1 Tax=Dialister micraerophilus TaxID=309120 RepID=UPI0023F242F7|nr:ATPase, T2SS/T4P/T4SS family [Dialister micraerophilus]